MVPASHSTRRSAAWRDAGRRASCSSRVDHVIEAKREMTQEHLVRECSSLPPAEQEAVAASANGMSTSRERGAIAHRLGTAGDTSIRPTVRVREEIDHLSGGGGQLVTTVEQRVLEVVGGEMREPLM